MRPRTDKLIQRRKSQEKNNYKFLIDDNLFLPFAPRGRRRARANLGGRRIRSTCFQIVTRIARRETREFSTLQNIFHKLKFVDVAICQICVPVHWFLCPTMCGVAQST